MYLRMHTPYTFHLSLIFLVTPPEKRDIELAITPCALWSPTHRYGSYCVKTDLKAV